MLTRARDLTLHLYGDRDPRTAERTLALARALWRADRPEEAEPLLRDAVERLDAALGPADPRAAAARVPLGRLLEDQGRGEEALALLGQARAALDPYTGSDSEHQPALVGCVYEYAAALLSAGRAEDAQTELLAAMPVHHCLYGGTRDASWMWRWATIEHALHGPGALARAHLALSMAWRHDDPPIGPFGGTRDWSTFFASASAPDAEPAVYARCVREGLAKVGEPVGTQQRQAAWLASVLRAQGFPDYARLLEAPAGNSATSAPAHRVP
jgi:tetratricopeptide (TPR) repeat protein